MTVAELIELLSTLDQERRVVVRAQKGGAIDRFGGTVDIYAAASCGLEVTRSEGLYLDESGVERCTTYLDRVDGYLLHGKGEL